VEILSPGNALGFGLRFACTEATTQLDDTLLKSNFRKSKFDFCYIYYLYLFITVNNSA